MKIPHTISKQTFEAYKPSQACLALSGEQDRVLQAEDTEWDNSLPPSLVEITVKFLAENFEEKPVLNELIEANRILLLETLRTDLPLPLVVPLIEDGIYWERCCTSRWNEPLKGMPYIRRHGNSWKRMYLERNLQENMQDFVPNVSDDNELLALAKLSAPYVRKLDIRELKVMHKEEDEDLEEECPYAEPPIDHLNFYPILRKLPNLQELHLLFGVQSCGVDFSWNLFNFSEADCNGLVKSIGKLKRLRLLRIHRSSMEDDRVITLVKTLSTNATIRVLDFSHNKIGDTGGIALGKLLVENTCVQKLVLTNNKLGPKGINGIAFGLIGNSTLRTLDLSLNPIADEGGLHICGALVRNTGLQELNLAGCRLEEEFGVMLGKVFTKNNTLQELDLTNNHLGEAAGEEILRGVQENSRLLHLDLRMTGVQQESEFYISEVLACNRSTWKRTVKEESQESIEEEPLLVGSEESQQTAPQAQPIEEQKRKESERRKTAILESDVVVDEAEPKDAEQQGGPGEDKAEEPTVAENTGS